MYKRISEMMATRRAAASSSTTSNGGGRAVAKAVQKLKDVQVNFLAIDFDQTFIDIHTGGNWQQTLDELLPHVRPEFRDLVQQARQHGIHVAIVTFSRQPQLIRHVLDHAVGTDVAETIPIRGGDRSWKYNGTGSKDGKQAHMASAVEELEQQQDQRNMDSNGNNNNIEITKATTLLIDDDARNVRIAFADGVRAVWFNPDKPHHLLRDIMNLV